MQDIALEDDVKVLPSLHQFESDPELIKRILAFTKVNYYCKKFCLKLLGIDLFIKLFCMKIHICKIPLIKNYFLQYLLIMGHFHLL